MEQIVKAIIENAVQQAIGAGASRDVLRYVLRSAIKTLQEVAPVVDTAGIDQWITDRCNRQPGEAVLAAELYDNYISWSGSSLSKQTFGRALTARGFLRKTRNDGCYWYGLLIKGTSVRDGITNWIAADCTIHPYARLPSKDLHAAFCKWFGRSISKQQFNGVLDDCGYVREGRVWRGLTTKAALMTDRQLLEQERAAAAARINQGV
jgi:hypothetical protein